MLIFSLPCSAQQVGFFNIGSGRIVNKIPGSGSGSGWVGVSKYTIGYFRVCRVFWVFLGIYGFIPDVSGYPLPDDFQNCIGSGRVSKEMPGSGSGSGTRWALNVADISDIWGGFGFIKMGRKFLQRTQLLL